MNDTEEHLDNAPDAPTPEHSARTEGRIRAIEGILRTRQLREELQSGSRALLQLRGEPLPVPGDASFADAAVASLSGRLRVEEGCEQTPEAIVLELIGRLKPQAGEEVEPPPPGKAPGPALRPEPPVTP